MLIDVQTDYNLTRVIYDEMSQFYQNKKSKQKSPKDPRIPISTEIQKHKATWFSSILLESVMQRMEKF